MARCITRSVSRLHITLVDLLGRLGRIDGGVGITLNSPRFLVEAEVRDRGEIELLCDPAYRDVAMKCASRYLRKTCRSCGARIGIKEGYELHIGLGGVTQLCLSIAKSLSASMGLDEDPIELARITGRGGTSGIGIYSFKLGGFIVDAGHRYPVEKSTIGPSDYVTAPPPPLITRIEIPGNWRFVLARPIGAKRIYGDLEKMVFEKGAGISEHEVWRVSHIVLMGLIPSVRVGDIDMFRKSISMIQDIGFKKIEWLHQDEAVWRVRKILADGGIDHGLSSMGPTIYVPCVDSWCEDISKHILKEDEWIDIDIVEARNQGAETVC